MKKSKKLLIALLSATCLTAGAFGLAACGSAQDDALYKIYTEYVADAGDNAKSYEEWLKDTLENVGKPGDKGEQGKPGDPGADGKSAYDIYKDGLDATETPLTQEEWLASLAGASGISPTVKDGYWYLGDTNLNVKAVGTDGVGIKSAAMSADGKKLVFTFTDDTTKEIELPESVTHVHTYNNVITTLIPPTGESEGLGYKVCTQNGCEHIELVVIGDYSYKISVFLSDFDDPESLENATGAEGATVTLKKGETTVATATTDASGVAIFEDVKRDDYSVAVTKDGYIQAEVITTEDKVYDYSAFLATLASDGDGSEDDAYQTTTNLRSEYFYLEAPKTGSRNVNICFTASKPGVYTFTNMNNCYFERPYAQVVTLSLDENESVSLTILNSSNEAVVFGVKCEEKERGTVDVPIAFKPGEQVSFTAADGEEYTYFKMSGDGTKYVVTYDNPDLQLYYLGTSLDGDMTLVSSSGSTIKCNQWSKTFYFAARGTDISFKLDYAEGTQYNPYNLELNKQETVTIPPQTYSQEFSCFKLTVESNVTYVIETLCDSGTAVTVYDSSFENPTGIYGTSSYAFEAGTYYIEAGAYNNYSTTDPKTCKFKVRAAVDDDLGKITSMPISFEGNTVALNVVAQSVYTVYTVPADGYVYFSSETISSSYFGYYSDAAFTEEISLRTFGDFRVNAGDKIYLKCNTTGTSGTNTITANFTPATATTTYTVNVSANDGSTVNGVTVKITDGDSVYSATVTGGVATFEGKPAGHYTVSVELPEGSDYKLGVLNPLYISLVKTTQDVTLIKYVDYTFSLTVPQGVELPEDLTFEIGGYNNRGRWTSYGKFTYAQLKTGSQTLKLEYNSDFEIIIYTGEYVEYELEGYEFTWNREGATVTMTFEEVTPVIPDNPNPPDDPNPFVEGATDFAVTAGTKYTFTNEANYVITVTGGSIESFKAGDINFVTNGASGGYDSWITLNYDSKEEKIISIEYTTDGREEMSIVFAGEGEITVTIEIS